MELKHIFDDSFQYIKIKFLKAYGWVDYDWKNPNTRVSQQKAKINDLSAELKELKDFKKNEMRYWGYVLKMINHEKMTKSQLDWYTTYYNSMVNQVQEERK